MRFYFKVFATALLCFSAVIGGGLYAFMNSADEPMGYSGALDPLQTKEGRVNVLMVGSDGGRSDTMMLVSYDPTLKLVDVVSIPRDTLCKVKGKTGTQSVKINAFFGTNHGVGGPEGVVAEVKALLKVPVNYYVNIDYRAVKEIVDILGGVEVDIPLHMKYDDPYCDPPLHINLPKGAQVLNGDKAIQFLRWRKNNDGSEQQGDLQRIERQHAFIKTAMKKAIGLKLPEVVSTTFKYMKTDMPMDKMLYYASTTVGLDPKKIQSYRIPGDAQMVDGTSYFVHDPVATAAMLQSIRNRTGTEALRDGTVTDVQEPEAPPVKGKLPPGPTDGKKPAPGNSSKQSGTPTSKP